MNSYPTLNQRADRGHSHIKSWLLAGVCLTLVTTTQPSKAVSDDALSYFNADGSRTANLEEAAQSWRNDSEFRANWGQAAIKAEYAYVRGITGRGVNVGVIDTGTDRRHSEFAGDGKLNSITVTGIRTSTDPNQGGPRVGDRFNLIGNDPQQSTYGNRGTGLDHGTHVAGTIAANRDRRGMMGVAYDASLTAANGSLHGEGYRIDNMAFRDAAIFDKIYQEYIKLGTRAINNSWGTGTNNSFRQAVQQLLSRPERSVRDSELDALAAGIVLIRSNGNSGGVVGGPLPLQGYFQPQFEDLVLQVTNLTSTNELSGSSTRCGQNKWTCVSAPGTNINSTVFNNGYGFKNGTSMASPHVTGVWALLAQRFPYLQSSYINDIIKTTSTDLGAAGIDNEFGWGLVNIQKAMDGPGQFINNFQVNLSSGTSDTFVNNIHDQSLDARRASDIQDNDELTAAVNSRTWPANWSGGQAQAMTDSEVEFLQTLIATRAAATETRAIDPLTGQTYKGSLTKSGDGTLTLSGQNTYRGSTWVRGGQLIINGSITSTTTVDNSGVGLSFTNPTTRNAQTGTKAGHLIVDGSSGDVNVGNGGRATINGDARSVQGFLNGLVDGSGRVGALAANNGALIAPGNSIGTLTASTTNGSGDVTFNKDSYYHAEISRDGKSDLIYAQNKATLNGGKVIVTDVNGTNTLGTLRAAAQSEINYEVLRADNGVTGQFESSTTGYLFFQPVLGYASNNVSLRISRLPFASVATTYNSKQVAAGLDSADSSSPLYRRIESTREGQLPFHFFDSLTGEIYASTSGALLNNGKHIADAVAYSTRLSDDIVNGESNLWSQGYGSWGKVDGDGNALGYRSNTYGMFAGRSGDLTENWTAGILGGYNKLKVSGSLANAQADSFQIGLYATTQVNGLNLHLGTAFAHHDISSKRRVTDTISTHANYTANTAQIFGEAGYELTYDQTKIEPYANLSYNYLSTGSFVEQGATGFGLIGRSSNSNLLLGGVGIRLSQEISLQDELKARLHGSAQWRYAAGDLTPSGTFAYLGGNNFESLGAPLARNAFALAAGIDFDVNKNAKFSVSYVGDLASRGNNHGVKASFNVKF